MRTIGPDAQQINKLVRFSAIHCLLCQLRLLVLGWRCCQRRAKITIIHKLVIEDEVSNPMDDHSNLGKLTCCRGLEHSLRRAVVEKRLEGVSLAPFQEMLQRIRKHGKLKGYSDECAE